MERSLLDVLLSDQPQSDRPEKPWLWERKGVEIPCCGLFTSEMREVRKAATTIAFNKVTHQREDVFDQDTFNDELIFRCTPGAPWTNEEVRKRYGVALARDVIRMAIRHPEDYGALLIHCMELCGLADELQGETPEEAVKNG